MAKFSVTLILILLAIVEISHQYHIGHKQKPSSGGIISGSYSSSAASSHSSSFSSSNSSSFSSSSNVGNASDLNEILNNLKGGNNNGIKTSLSTSSSSSSASSSASSATSSLHIVEDLGSIDLNGGAFNGHNHQNKNHLNIGKIELNQSGKNGHNNAQNSYNPNSDQNGLHSSSSGISTSFKHQDTSLGVGNNDQKGSTIDKNTYSKPAIFIENSYDNSDQPRFPITNNNQGYSSGEYEENTDAFNTNKWINNKPLFPGPEGGILDSKPAASIQKISNTDKQIYNVNSGHNHGSYNVDQGSTDEYSDNIQSYNNQGVKKPCCQGSFPGPSGHILDYVPANSVSSVNKEQEITVHVPLPSTITTDHTSHIYKHQEIFPGPNGGILDSKPANHQSGIVSSDKIHDVLNNKDYNYNNNQNIKTDYNSGSSLTSTSKTDVSSKPNYGNYYHNIDDQDKYFTTTNKGSTSQKPLIQHPTYNAGTYQQTGSTYFDIASQHTNNNNKYGSTAEKDGVKITLFVPKEVKTTKTTTTTKKPNYSTYDYYNQNYNTGSNINNGDVIKVVVKPITDHNAGSYFNENNGNSHHSSDHETYYTSGINYYDKKNTGISSGSNYNTQKYDATTTDKQYYKPSSYGSSHGNSGSYNDDKLLQQQSTDDYFTSESTLSNNDKVNHHTESYNIYHGGNSYNHNHNQQNIVDKSSTTTKPGLINYDKDNINENSRVSVGYQVTETISSDVTKPKDKVPYSVFTTEKTIKTSSDNPSYSYNQQKDYDSFLNQGSIQTSSVKPSIEKNIYIHNGADSIVETNTGVSQTTVKAIKQNENDGYSYNTHTYSKVPSSYDSLKFPPYLDSENTKISESNTKKDYIDSTSTEKDTIINYENNDKHDFGDFIKPELELLPPRKDTPKTTEKSTDFFIDNGSIYVANNQNSNKHKQDVLNKDTVSNYGDSSTSIWYNSNNNGNVDNQNLKKHNQGTLIKVNAPNYDDSNRSTVYNSENKKHIDKNFDEIVHGSSGTYIKSEERPSSSINIQLGVNKDHDSNSADRIFFFGHDGTHAGTSSGSSAFAGSNSFHHHKYPAITFPLLHKGSVSSSISGNSAASYASASSGSYSQSFNIGEDAKSGAKVYSHPNIGADAIAIVDIPLKHHNTGSNNNVGSISLASAHAEIPKLFTNVLGGHSSLVDGGGFSSSFSSSSSSSSSASASSSFASSSSGSYGKHY